MIKREGNKYVVYSESGRRFGTYSNEKDAKRRLAQMEMFKHIKKTAAYNKSFGFSPMLVRSVLNKTIDSLNTKAIEDYAKIARKIDGMLKDHINKVVKSGKTPTKADIVMQHVLEHSRNKLGRKFMGPNPNLKINNFNNN